MQWFQMEQTKVRSTYYIVEKFQCFCGFRKYLKLFNIVNFYLVFFLFSLFILCLLTFPFTRLHINVLPFLSFLSSIFLLNVFCRPSLISRELQGTFPIVPRTSVLNAIRRHNRELSDITLHLLYNKFQLSSLLADIGRVFTYLVRVPVMVFMCIFDYNLPTECRRGPSWEFDIQRAVHRDIIVIIKANEMHYFSTLFW